MLLFSTVAVDTTGKDTFDELLQMNVGFLAVGAPEFSFVMVLKTDMSLNIVTLKGRVPEVVEHTPELSLKL